MNKIEAKTNFDYCEETIKLKGDLELSYLKLAERLYRIHLNKMYQPNFETFEEFLEEVKISRATASKMINIHLIFVMRYKISEKKLAMAGGWTVLAEILPYATSKVKANEFIEHCRHLTRSDLRKFITEEKSGIRMSECSHKNEEVITFAKCLDCGETRRIYDDSNKK